MFDHSSSLAMKLTAAIVSLAALLLPSVQGQLCNGLPCAANAACDAATQTCMCNSGFSGNGRVACRPSDRCICTALADPVFNLFDVSGSPQTPKANLPCSVRLVGNTLFGPPTCTVSGIYAHPETRGTGTMQNTRVFVKEIEVDLLQPANAKVTVSASGTTTDPPNPGLVQSNSQDGYNTATVNDCQELQIGYNSTYGGAFVDLARSTPFSEPGLCGDCDNTADENVGTTNITNLAYFLKNVAPVSNQKGPYASECGVLESSVQSLCNNDQELNQAADICGRYLTSFGTCLVDDATVTAISDYGQLLSVNVIPCVVSVCVGQIANACTTLQQQQTTACQLGPLPASCQP